MIITSNINKTRRVILEAKRESKTIGFIPTMGALHQGHLSLVDRARKECEFSVVSIFVNPVQFCRGEDYSFYPRPLKEDKELLAGRNVDLVFIPAPDIMYPPDYSVYVVDDELSGSLCGRSRPGHFRGVCTVVAKLFNIITPDTAYFGQKDYQQALILCRLARDLNFAVKIKILPIIRAADGLALSSRNVYLNKEQRERARCLYSALMSAKFLIQHGERDPRKVKNKIKQEISSAGGKIDYVEIVDADNLRKLDKIGGKVLIALAVYIGKIRLIDNIIVKTGE